MTTTRYFSNNRDFVQVKIGNYTLTMTYVLNLHLFEWNY